MNVVLDDTITKKCPRQLLLACKMFMKYIDYFLGSLNAYFGAEYYIQTR